MNLKFNFKFSKFSVLEVLKSNFLYKNS